MTANVVDGVETWLIGQDVAVEFQTRRDLVGQFDAGLQRRIGREGAGGGAAVRPRGGWPLGARLLSA